MPRTKLKKFITFGAPNISEHEVQAVSDVLRSGWIGTGKVAREFEEEFVKYMGGGYAVAVSSATIGLSIALKSIGIAPNDNILTTPLTFCATVNSILQIGAKPIFADVEEDGCLNLSEHLYLKGKIDACVPVNYLGKQAPPKLWNQLPVPVIEDAAHSFGGFLLGQKQGTFGTISVFSFYATKNITAGEAGMIYTRSFELAARCRMLSNHGQSSGAWSRYSSGPINNYKVMSPGFKGNLPDVLAAIGLIQLRRWPLLLERRNRVWKLYEEAFGKKGVGHSKHLYTIQVKNRAKVREQLYDLGIGTGIHYEALHLQPAYQYLGYKKGDFPVAEKIGEETLSLPVSNSMTESDAEYVVDCVKSILKGNK